MVPDTQIDSGGDRRILVVRLGSMGDIVHTLPAVAALRCAFPSAEIGWAVEERWSELLCARGTAQRGPRSAQRPLVDRVHLVSTLRWRQVPFSSQTGREALAAVRNIRAGMYEIAIDFQGALKSAFLVQWSGAPVRVGFVQPRERAASVFYTRPVMVDAKHIVEQNVALAQSVIGHAQSPSWEFPLPHDPAEEAWCEQELKRLNVPPLSVQNQARQGWGIQECEELKRRRIPTLSVQTQDGQGWATRSILNFAIINPGAGWGAKCWPPERYAEVARALRNEGVLTLINIGPAEEELGRAIQTASCGAAQTIRCSVGQLIALARRARLAIGGDTGPLHLAAALGIPVVGIYGPTDPARNGPVGSPSIVIRNANSETSHRRLAQTEAGLMNITAAEVIAAARRLLVEACA